MTAGIAAVTFAAPCSDTAIASECGAPGMVILVGDRWRTATIRSGRAGKSGQKVMHMRFSSIKF